MGGCLPGRTARYGRHSLAARRPPQPHRGAHTRPARGPRPDAAAIAVSDAARHAVLASRPPATPAGGVTAISWNGRPIRNPIDQYRASSSRQRSGARPCSSASAQPRCEAPSRSAQQPSCWLLPGCREGGRAAGNDAAGAVFAAGAKRATDLHLAYSHDITIGLLARQVEPHFIAARDHCLSDASRHCVLIKASIEQEMRAILYPPPSCRSAMSTM